jgi:hypothetical protein
VALIAFAVVAAVCLTRLPAAMAIAAAAGAWAVVALVVHVAYQVIRSWLGREP